MNTNNKYSIFKYILTFLTIIVVPFSLLKIYGFKKINNNFAAVFSSTPDSTTPETDNGETYAIIADGSGGVYIGGDFAAVGGISRNRIAHILSNGTVDPNFDPSLDSWVEDFALSSDRSILYMAGNFTTVGTSSPVTRNYIAALNTSDGSVVTSFDPGLSGQSLSLDLSSDDSILYVGGNFNTIGTSSPITRNHLAAINTSDGSVVTGFDPNVNNEIFDMKLSSDGNLLYIGGAFNTVNGSTTRNFVAAVNTTSGLVNSFDPSPDDWVYSLDISSDQNILYIGGLFSIVGVSSPVTRNRIAAVNASDGSVVTGFDPNANNAVYTIGLSSNTLYIGGDFTTIGSTTRNRIAAVNATDGSLVTTFDPNVNQYVYSSGFSSNRLYIGGNFTTVGGVSPSYFASFSVPQSPSYGGSSSYVSPFVSTSSAPDTSLSTSTPVPTATDIETIPVGTSTITDTSVPTLTAYQFTFSQVLKLGSMGEEVRQLQVFLNTHGFPVAQTGNGSLGKESIYFGIKTHRALIKFQEAYKEEILIPQGLTQGTGIFLNYSKRVANAILLGQKR